MNGRGRIYQGKKYKFKLGKRIGKGGNGEVYEVDILNCKSSGTYVVKFLSINRWRGKKRELRYNRFFKEIHTVVELQEDTTGIMKILDYYCPDKIQENDSVWYLMERAESFKDFSSRNKLDLKAKLSYLIDLSNILCDLHYRRYSHRDIKLDNLLIINGRLMLSDFGLIWNTEDFKITMEGERLGPFFVGPPELESRDPKMVDFRPSDVYLFSKVVWETVKEDYFGFRGEYIRSNKQFYLNPLDYGVSTFEPIHQLLEQSTKPNISERIDIHRCRELLNEQLFIINNDDQDKDKELQYRFCELQKEILNKHTPDKRIYSNGEAIYDILKSFIPISDIIIDVSNEKMNIDSIEKWIDNGAIILKSSKISQVNSYLCYPEYIVDNSYEDEIELYIKPIERKSIHNGFISYEESKKVSWGVRSNDILLDESLVIKLRKIFR
ncbi:protein kinase domain-containing protein [Paraclostridium sordellii]|uniref:Serine/threonine protein kinase n=1 Tax=Paraclostridium sordellii TaxID=1505 RepID=A0A9P1L256_PARSO|nr:protein kinase [Paeniclostridium sordellii]CEO33249.1 serine/threonine protein kinase [[Clostridium] sordellii] [Paeniclostridium sordellii]